MSALLRQIQSFKALEKAWRVIYENGKNSKSEDVRNEVQEFNEDAYSRLKSLTSKLAKRSFTFLPGTGIPIAKKDKNNKKIPNKIRPIVLANVESRIVQRTILKALVSIEKLQPYFINPYSFGGIEKGKKEDLSAVPAAIDKILKCIASGSKFVVYADITGFFTKIPKPIVIKIVGDAVEDEEFMLLFKEAITTELSNMAELRAKGLAEKFPIGDIGVAQGNSLSPLLGNIILHDFDKRMNDKDCQCIRYIDDFIILAPTRKAAIAKLKLARRLLKELGMELSPDKTQDVPIPVNEKIEFLGIELSSGLIRPAAKAQANLLYNIKDVLRQSKATLLCCAKENKRVPKKLSFSGVLKTVDGIIQGWSKHYWFCNDKRMFKNIDEDITRLLKDYQSAYSAIIREQSDDLVKREMLGIELLSNPSRPHKREPFSWPKLKPSPQSAV